MMIQNTLKSEGIDSIDVNNIQDKLWVFWTVPPAGAYYEIRIYTRQDLEKALQKKS